MLTILASMSMKLRQKSVKNKLKIIGVIIWLFQLFFVYLHQQKELRYEKIKKRNSWFRIGRYIDVG